MLTDLSMLHPLVKQVALALLQHQPPHPPDFIGPPLVGPPHRQPVHQPPFWIPPPSIRPRPF